MIKSRGEWIDGRYQVLNSFPFVIGVLYYTEVENKEKVKQKRFVQALDLKKFESLQKEEELLEMLPKRDQSIFFPLQEILLEDQLLYQVYTELEGYLLAHYIKKHFPLQLSDILHVARQVIAHLQALYEQDAFAIVHPQNIIVSAERSIRFLYGGGADLLPKGTMLGQGKKAEMLYDSYGLGVLVYQMISGNLPTAGGLKTPELTEFLPTCPKPLNQLVMRSLSFDMAKRPTIDEYQLTIDELIS